MTEKPISVTEEEQNVTRDSVTSSRAHALSEGMSRLSRVTDTGVTVTKVRDSDSHSPDGRDHHGQGRADCGQEKSKLPARCIDCQIGQGRDCACREPRLVHGGQMVVGVLLGLAAWALVAVVLRGIAGGAL